MWSVAVPLSLRQRGSIRLQTQLLVSSIHYCHCRRAAKAVLLWLAACKISLPCIQLIQLRLRNPL
jgi:hypothetical protein